jgi:hypothetical protein
MKSLIAFVFMILSVANFAHVNSGNQNKAKEVANKFENNSKPKRPPVSDDGPSWPPVPFQ